MKIKQNVIGVEDLITKQKIVITKIKSVSSARRRVTHERCVELNRRKREKVLAFKLLPKESRILRKT